RAAGKCEIQAHRAGARALCQASDRMSIKGNDFPRRDRTMTAAAAEKRAATSSGTEPVREAVPPLKQRIAFVSGGMGGIGSAVCRRLARNGARGVAGCLPGYEKEDEWLAEMRSEGLPGYAAGGDGHGHECSP